MASFFDLSAKGPIPLDWLGVAARPRPSGRVGVLLALARSPFLALTVPISIPVVVSVRRREPMMT